MIDVSIIIPTFNRLWSLPKAIESCRNTRLNIEIIVVDDGSTDDTKVWLKNQSQIVTIFQNNQGKTYAVNNGLAIAKGKYIRFLDSDDWILPFSTDDLFKHAENHQLDVVCAGYQLFEDEMFIKEIAWVNCDDFLAQQLGECDSSHYSAYLFKKEFIDTIPHRQEYGALDDRAFVIEVAMKQPNVGFITGATLAHRLHKKMRLQGQRGLQQSVNHLARLTIYKKCFNVLSENGNLTARRKNAACNTLWHLAHWVAKTDLTEAEEIYKWVYELNPAFLPTENLIIARLYKFMGFKNAERLLRARRFFK